MQDPGISFVTNNTPIIFLYDYFQLIIVRTYSWPFCSPLCIRVLVKSTRWHFSEEKNYPYVIWVFWANHKILISIKSGLLCLLLEFPLSYSPKLLTTVKGSETTMCALDNNNFWVRQGHSQHSIEILGAAIFTPRHPLVPP